MTRAEYVRIRCVQWGLWLIFVLLLTVVLTGACRPSDGWEEHQIVKVQAGKSDTCIATLDNKLEVDVAAPCDTVPNRVRIKYEDGEATDVEFVWPKEKA